MNLTMLRLLAGLAPALGVSALQAQPLADLGRVEYEKHCSSCHGVDGRGDGPDSVALKVPVPDLTALARRHAGVYPADRVRRVIDGREDLKGHGGRQMPIWGLRYGQQAREGSQDQAADAENEIGRRVQALSEYVRAL